MAAEAKPANRQWYVKHAVKGMPTKDDFELKVIDYPSITDGEFVAKTLYVSVDPYHRGVIGRGAQPTTSCVGQVVESKHDGFPVGTTIFHYAGWQEYVKSVGSTETKCRILDPAQHGPLSASCGILGMPGMTAYVGLLNVAELKEGDVVMVSGAAGAVGSAVVQIAKIKNCKVIGTVGSADKQEYIKSLGCDVALNYKELDTAAKVSAAIQEAAPNGVDVYFDNTGGHVTHAVFPNLAKWARVAVCGQISMYNDVEPPQAPSMLHHLIYKNVTIRGFMVYDAMMKVGPQRFADFFKDMGGWIASGQVKYEETVVEGFDNLIDAFLDLFSGKNVGKMLVKC